MKSEYTLESRGITVRFTADQISKKDRLRLSEELRDLYYAESMHTDEFLRHKGLYTGSYTLLPEKYPTIGELSLASDKELLLIRSFGKRRLYFLREALREEGYFNPHAPKNSTT